AIPCRPSLFDTTQTTSGTCVVDAVGQHAGVLQVAPNAGNVATLSVTAGWIRIATRLDVGVLGTATVQQSGGLIDTPATVIAGGSSFNQSGGVANLGAVSGAGAMNVTGGTANVTYLRNASATVDGSGRVNVAANGTAAGTSKISSLNLSGGGQLDLSDNHLIVSAAGASA